jgi:hypothetical protein
MAIATILEACQQAAPAIMAVIITICYCATMTLLCLVSIPESSRPEVDTMIRVIGSVWGSLVAYLVGARGLQRLRKARARAPDPPDTT